MKQSISVLIIQKQAVSGEPSPAFFQGNSNFSTDAAWLGSTVYNTHKSIELGDEPIEIKP